MKGWAWHHHHDQFRSKVRALRLKRKSLLTNISAVHPRCEVILEPMMFNNCCEICLTKKTGISPVVFFPLLRWSWRCETLWNWWLWWSRIRGWLWHWTPPAGVTTKARSTSHGHATLRTSVHGDAAIHATSDSVQSEVWTIVAELYPCRSWKNMWIRYNIYIYMNTPGGLWNWFCSKSSSMWILYRLFALQNHELHLKMTRACLEQTTTNPIHNPMFFTNFQEGTQIQLYKIHQNPKPRWRPQMDSICKIQEFLYEFFSY